MASDSTRPIAIAALMLAVCAIGILVGRWTVDSPSPVQPHVESSAQMDLAPLITEMRRSNEAFLDAVRERVPTGSQPMSTRESAVPDSDALGRLAAAIERNNTLLERADVERRTQREAHARSRGPGYPSLDAMFETLDAIANVGDPAWPEKLPLELRGKHDGWTRDDLIERYGAPGSVTGSEHNVSIIYSRPAGSQNTGSVLFVLVQGLVSETYLN